MLSDQQSRAEVSHLSTMLMGPQSMNVLRNLQSLAVILLGFVSVTVEAFIRRDFGSRYWTLLRVVAAWQVMRFYVLLLNLPEIVRMSFGMGRPMRSMADWFTYAFLVLALVHLFRNWQRHRAGIPWHSQSFGISWLSFLPVHDYVLYRFIEPACVLVAGWLLSSVDGPTGGWLVLAGMALFVRNNMTFSMMRDRYLDIIDARIESRYFNEVQSGKPKQQTAGWQVVPIPQGNLFGDEDEIDISATVRETMQTATANGAATGHQPS